MENKQYTFTDCIKYSSNKKLILDIKVGLTKKEVDNRINQQKNSSNNYKIFEWSSNRLISNCSDNAIRKQMYKQMSDVYTQNTDADGTEWLMMTIPKNIIENYNIADVDKNNSKQKYSDEVLKAIGNRIQEDKIKCIKILDNVDKVNIVTKKFKARTHQEKILKEILEFLDKNPITTENKNFIILDLCCRFGKTLTILALMKRLSKINNIRYNLILPNHVHTIHTSFKNDYTEFGFDEFFDIHYISKQSKKEINKIKNLKNTILVIDEVDYGNDTTDAIENYNILIKNNNIETIIAMSGTGIESGYRISNKLEIKKENISFHKISYLEMLKLSPKTTVPIHLINIKLKPLIQNLHESLQNDKNNLYFVDLIHSVILGKHAKKHEATQKGISYVYIPGLKSEAKYNLELIQDELEKKFPEIICFNLIGENTTNKESQKATEKLIKNNPKKQIILFTNGFIATRSFSVKAINRTILITDSSDISNAQKQFFDRLLTFDKNNPNKIGYITRVSSNDLVFFPIMLSKLGNNKNYQQRDFSCISDTKTFQVDGVKFSSSDENGDMNTNEILKNWFTNTFNEMTTTEQYIEKNNIEDFLLLNIDNIKQNAHIKKIKNKNTKDTIYVDNDGKIINKEDLEKILKTETKTDKLKTHIRNYMQRCFYIPIILYVANKKQVPTLDTLLNLDDSIWDKYFKDSIFKQSYIKLKNNINSDIDFKSYLQERFDSFKYEIENDIDNINKLSEYIITNFYK